MTDTKREKFNLRIYGKLLLDVLPRPIETGAENERALAVIDRLMSKGEDNLTPEEGVLPELLVAVPEPVAFSAGAIASFSVDIARRADGIERIVEIGDGQVSDLVGWSVERFVGVWDEAG